MKLTFKREKRVTGLAGIGHPYRNTFIKGDKKHVGLITGPNHRDATEWEIRFCIKREVTVDRPAPFRWVTLKTKFNDEPAARQFVIDRWQDIQRAHDLFQIDMEDY